MLTNNFTGVLKSSGVVPQTLLFNIELAALSPLVIVSIAIDYIHKIASGHFDYGIVSKEINLGRPTVLTISRLTVHMEHFSLFPQCLVVCLRLNIDFRFISKYFIWEVLLQMVCFEVQIPLSSAVIEGSGG